MAGGWLGWAAGRSDMHLPSPFSNLNLMLLQIRACLILYLPDEDVGAVLGRKGQSLIEIQQVRPGI